MSNGAGRPRRLAAVASHLHQTCPRMMSSIAAALAAPPPASSIAASSSAAAGRKAKKRVAIGKLQQETNDLSPIPTTKAYFTDQGFLTGGEVMTRGREGSTEGFMTAIERWGDSAPFEIELVGIAHTAVRLSP